MPQYTVTHPDGRLVTLTGDAPPSESDLDEIFSQIGSRKPAAAEDFTQAPAQPEGSAVGRFLGNAWDALNPLTALEAAGHAVAHPIDTASALVGAQVGEGKKALADLRAGRYSEAIGHGGAALLPVLGPAEAAAGEQIGAGDVAGGLGKAVGLLAPMVAGALPKTARVSGPFAAADPAVADAAALAERSGVPLDAATASGNRFVKAAQHLADRSLGGSAVAGPAEVAQKSGLATLGEQLAAKGYETPVTPEDAGDAVRAAVQKQVEGNAGLANDAYDVLRKIEADPSKAKIVPGPNGSMQLMPLPVNLESAQKALAPLYEDLQRQAQLTPAAMMGQKATALQALDKLMNGPTHAPLSTVDAALSDLKAFARSGKAADVPALATPGQAAAKQAITQLDGLVQRTASEAGPDALSALREGRKATIAKYAAADVLDGLQGGSVRTLNKLVAPGDANIDALRDVARQAPDVLPQVGRAALDRYMAMEPAKASAEWSKLGQATKQVLYSDPAYAKDLDSFFRLRKMAAENPNPSGTAHTLATMSQAGMVVSAPWIGVPVQLGAAAVSKLLHSPTGVKLLTKGMQIPIGNKAAGAAWMADLANATGQATSPSGFQSQSTALAR